LARHGDITVFECLSESEIIWLFNSDEKLPSKAYKYYSIEKSTYVLIILIENDSYYGDYKCEGEMYEENYAFYALATLKKCKLAVILVLYSLIDLVIVKGETNG